MLVNYFIAPENWTKIGLKKPARVPFDNVYFSGVLLGYSIVLELYEIVFGNMMWAWEFL